MKNTTDQEVMIYLTSLASFKDERFFLFQLHVIWKIFIWFIYCGTLIIGSYAKIVLYCHIFKTKLKDQPINVLIFAEQAVHHFCNIFILTGLCLSIPLDMSPGFNFTDHFLLQLKQISIPFYIFDILFFVGNGGCFSNR